MGKLTFIGLGLCDDKSLTLEALEACTKSDVLFMESYTSALSPGSLERLEKKVGKTVQIIGREEVEKGDFLNMIKEMKVGLMIPGDPMTATTHIDLRIRAHDMGMETIVVHGTSALIAVPGILGLQHYRFGRTITIPYPQKGFEPTSPVEQLLENYDRGLHTLVLLDIQADQDRYMNAIDGLKQLIGVANKIKASSKINENTFACVVARAGAPSCIAKANLIKNLLGLDFGEPLHSIVIPGKLHFEEIESLVRFADAPRELFSK